MQSRVLEIGLGLNAGSSCDATPGCPGHEVFQQGRLAHPRLATQDQHLAPSCPRSLQHSVEDEALAPPTAERRRAVSFGDGRTRTSLQLAVREAIADICTHLGFTRRSLVRT